MTTMMIRAAAALLVLAAACAQPPAQAQPAHLRFATTPSQRWELPDALREISGLAVSPDGRLFAHDDEHARIYEIDWRSGRLVKSFSLGEPALTGDFEGLAIAPNGDFWLTTSTGQLYRFREAGDGAHVSPETFDTGLANVCEIEGLAYLAAEESLILACKRNEAREMRDTISLHRWPIGGGAAQPWRSAPEATIAQSAGVARFRPSSLDADPRTGRLILLAATDGAWVELDADGAVIGGRALGPEHVQPEGVAVLPDGSLAIADEAGSRRNVARLAIYPEAAQ